ncbi:MAG: hypothetical protein JKY67_21030 [Pseudomonadales bacterium]|nr:hypothetical protein [Pseudomonadales bacterium]
MQWNSLLAREKTIHYSSSETSPGHWAIGMGLFKNVFPFIESMSEDTIYFMRAIQGLHQILHRLGADVSFTLHQELAGQGS